MKAAASALACKGAGVCIRCVVLMAAGLLLLGLEAALGQEMGTRRIAVLLSRDIRPYFAAADGLARSLAARPGWRTRVFSLGKVRGRAREELLKSLAGGAFDAVVAVGPVAARTVWRELDPVPPLKAYAVVLNPEKILPPADVACGVALNIPLGEQLAAVRKGLPSAHRLGLLYDPAYNQTVFDRGAAAAGALALELVPLAVSSKREIPAVLAGAWAGLDALWLVPDRTVISETLVRFVIKEALLRRVPVIGYNRFFYESGAALAFIFDYQRLGEQVGEQLIRRLSGVSCRAETPRYQAWLNPRVLRKLGAELPAEPLPPLEVGP